MDGRTTDTMPWQWLTGLWPVELKMQAEENTVALMEKYME